MPATNSIDVIAVFASLIGIVFSVLLVYGLQQKWRWIVDPPEWMFMIYFPAVVKIVGGPNMFCALHISRPMALS
jgi:cellulose synthase/poly-beta-1,6-N-acetylglucosamine synthase-like glycosyltransferase